MKKAVFGGETAMSACGASSSTGRNEIVCRNAAIAHEICYPTPMNASSCQSLVAELERDPEQVPAYHGNLESALKWLMDATFKSTDPKEKTYLASIEMRARLVLERWRKGHRN